MQRLDPKAKYVFFFRTVLSAVLFLFATSLGLVAVLVDQVDSFLDIFLEITMWWWLPLIVGVAGSWWWADLTNRFYGYELRENEFRKESGVITKKYVSIPYVKIQNVDINRTLIDRIMGLSEIRIQTAGSSAVTTRSAWSGLGAEGVLPGLAPEVAESLRDELTKRAGKSSL